MSVSCRKAFTLNIAGAAPPLAWWKMEEGGVANRIDAVNGVQLRAAPGAGAIVSSGAGKIGNGVEFSSPTGNQAALNPFDDLLGFPNSTTSGISVVFWANWLAFTGGGGLWAEFVNYEIDDSLFNPLVVLRGFWFALGNLFQVRMTAVGVAQLPAAGVVFNPVIGTWNFFHVYYNGSTGRVGLQINNGAATESVGTTALAGAWSNAAALMHFDTIGTDIKVDEYGIFPYLLSQTQRDFIYNAGAGKQWPFSLPP